MHTNTQTPASIHAHAHAYVYALIDVERAHSLQTEAHIIHDLQRIWLWHYGHMALCILDL